MEIEDVCKYVGGEEKGIKVYAMLYIVSQFSIRHPVT